MTDAERALHEILMAGEGLMALGTDIQWFSVDPPRVIVAEYVHDDGYVALADPRLPTEWPTTLH